MILFSRCFILACKPTQKTVIPAWVPYDRRSSKTAANASHKMQYKVIQSKILDKMTFGKICKSDK
jgi:amidase